MHGIRNVQTELRSTEKDAHLGNGESCRLLPWFDISHTVERIVPFLLVVSKKLKTVKNFVKTHEVGPFLISAQYEKLHVNMNIV